MVARRVGGNRVPPSCEPREQDAGDHEGPPTPTSTTLAPTDRPASYLAFRLRLMPIRADKSAVCTINRHLRWVEYPHRGCPGYFVNVHNRAPTFSPRAD